MPPGIMQGAKKKMEEYVKRPTAPQQGQQQQAQPPLHQQQQQPSGPPPHLPPPPPQHPHPQHPPPPVPVPIPNANGQNQQYHGNGPPGSPRERHQAPPHGPGRLNTTSRQALAEAARMPVPVGSRFTSNNNGQQQQSFYQHQQHGQSQQHISVPSQLAAITAPASAPLPTSHALQAIQLQDAPKLRRARTNSNRSREGSFWPDTAFLEGGVFPEPDASPPGGRPGRSNSMSKYERGDHLRGDRFDERAIQQRQRQYERGISTSAVITDDEHRFIIGKGGLMTVLSSPTTAHPPPLQVAASGVAPAINSGLASVRHHPSKDFHDIDAHYHSAPLTNAINGGNSPHQLHHHGSGLLNVPTSRPSKLPLREPKRRQTGDRPGGYAGGDDLGAILQQQQQPQETNYENEAEGLDSLRGSDVGLIAAANAVRRQSSIHQNPHHQHLHSDILPKRSTLFENVDSMSDLQLAEQARATQIQQQREMLLHQKQQQLQQHQQQQQFQQQQAAGAGSAIPRPSRQSSIGHGKPSPLRLGGAAGEGSAAGPSATGPPMTTTSVSTRNLRKRQHSLDYDDTDLRSMSYSDLKRQAFDFNPRALSSPHSHHTISGGRPGSRGGAGSSSSQGSLRGLSEQQFNDLLGSNQNRDELDQQRFFGTMSVEDWDQAGDWFLDRFQDIVSQLKNQRRIRRRISEKFEAELATREEAVRGKIDGINQTLTALKHDGTSMMRGKDVEV